MDAQTFIDLLVLTERVGELEQTVQAQAAQLHGQARQIALLQQQLAHLKSITPAFLQEVSALVQDRPSLIAARDHVWNLHTDRFLDRLDAAFARAIGAETLTPGQQQTVREAFRERVPDKHTDPVAHAAFARRYEASDDTLIDDFLMKEYQFGVVGERLHHARTAVTRGRRREPALFFDALPRWKMN